MKFPGAVLLNKGDDAKPDWLSATATATVRSGVNTATSPFNNIGTVRYANTLTSVSAAGAAPSSFTYSLPLTSGASAVTTSASTLTVNGGGIASAGSWYWTPDTPTELVKSVWRGRPKAEAHVANPRTLDTADVAQGPTTPLSANAEASSAEPPSQSVASQSQKRVRRFRAQRAAVTTKRMTNLAVLIAGERGPALGDEWCSHLAGESGRGLASSRQARDAARGFLIAALRTRLQDAADLAWRPVDAVLASRELSNLIVMLATLIVAEISIHGAGRYGLVSNLANIAVTWPATYGLIRLGRWWRSVKPPEHKPRCSKELAPLALTRSRVTTQSPPPSD